MIGTQRPAFVRLILVKEVRDLLRDRRAVFFAFVVPLFLYPAIIGFFAWKPAQDKQSLEERELHIAFSGPYDLFYDRLVTILGDANVIAEKAVFDPEYVRDEQVAVHVAFRDGSSGSLSAKVYHVTTSPASQEARRRLGEALATFRDLLIKDRFRQQGRDLEPGDLVLFEDDDISTAEETSRVAFGRFLPILLVLLLLTGGAFASLDLVAGEKERGTLETLYIHPVPIQAIVWGKFLVILFASLLSVLLNFAGMAVAVLLSDALGWTPPQLGGQPLVLPPVSTFLLVFVLSVPLAILLSAVLLALSSYAGSFREAQTYLLPLSLLGMVAGLPAMSPLVELKSAVVVVPVANVALAVREALEGSLDITGSVLTFGVTSLYALIALRFAAGLLEREDIVLRLEAPVRPSDLSIEERSRRAIFFGAVMLLVLYFAGSSLQTWSFYPGLAVTLWVVVLIPALVYPLAVADQRAGWASVFAEWTKHLGLASTRFRNFALTIPMTAALFVLMGGYMVLQDQFLPFPEELETTFRELIGADDLSLPLRIALFAASPAICEELLWRGAVQGEVQARGRTVFTLVVIGIFFGLFHLSIYRFLLTGMLGALLAWMRLRTGSIFPCMLLHGIYNATVMYWLQPFFEDEQLTSIALHPLSLGAAGFVLFVSLYALKKS